MTDMQAGLAVLTKFCLCSMNVVQEWYTCWSPDPQMQHIEAVTVRVSSTCSKANCVLGNRTLMQCTDGIYASLRCSQQGQFRPLQTGTYSPV